jgi:hypothetical protein
MLLGDALALRPVQSGPWLRGSAAGQLARVTVEGLIRAHVRATHKGICHPPLMVWLGYRR